MGSPCWSRILAGPVALWREVPTLAGPVTLWWANVGAVCSWRTARHGRDPHRSILWITIACGKDLHWSKATAWEVLSLRRKKRQKQCDELAATPISCPPAALRGGGGQSGIKFSPWWREWLGKHDFKIWVCFSLFYYYFIGKKFNNFPEFSLVWPWL